jgi:hypothetical protein
MLPMPAVARKYFVCAIDLALALYYFKQLVQPDFPIPYLDLSGIMLMPFTFLYSFIAFVLVDAVMKADFLSPHAGGFAPPATAVAYGLLLAIVAVFFLFAAVIGIQQLLVAFLIAAYETFKSPRRAILSYYKAPARNLALMALTFVLLVVSISVPLDGSQDRHAYLMGALYFLALIVIDYRSILATEAQQEAGRTDG